MLTEKFLFFLVTIIIPEQGPFLKDQVTERGESTRGWVPFTDPVWSSYSPKSSSSNSQQATIKLAPRFDGEPIFTDQAGEDTNDNLLQPRLDSGPTFKDQVHAVYSGPTFKDQAHTAVPGAAAVPGPGKAQREDSEGASQSSVEAEDEGRTSEALVFSAPGRTTSVCGSGLSGSWSSAAPKPDCSLELGECVLG